MILTNAFKEAVTSGNILRVRIMLKDSLLNDTTFKEFDLMESEASILSGLYDKHDGCELDFNKDCWNDSYMNELMVQIVRNFSEARVNHLKEVVKHLRPARVQTPSYHRKTVPQRSRIVLGGTVIGAMAGGTIATIASVSLVGGVAVGAITGAVIGSIITKGEII